MADDLEKPEGLTALGEKAHAAIVEFLKAHDLTYTGGCKAFYSPAEWKARGEEYGLESELIVVHDGGSVGRAFSLDKEDYATEEAMRQHLAPLGLFHETCTSWYSAVYRIQRGVMG